MQKNPTSQSGLFYARVLAFMLCFVVVLLATLGFVVPTPLSGTAVASPLASTPPASADAVAKQSFIKDSVIPRSSVQLDKLPLSFEPNNGQTDPAVRFRAHLSKGTIAFMASEVVLRLAGKTSKSPSASFTNTTLRQRFLGADSPKLAGGELLPGKVSYFIGSNSKRWQKDLPTYENVVYSGLYPGIDLTFAGSGGELKSTYVVAPGADPTSIRWRYHDAESVSTNQAGELQIRQGSTSVRECAPVAWQDIGGRRLPVAARYLINDRATVSFAVGLYDRAYPLTIDPSIVYSTYFGVGGDEPAYTVGVDAQGNAYVSGFYNPTNVTDGYDVFVVKLNPSGSTILYQTIFGGDANDLLAGGGGGTGMAVDTAGNVYLTGVTYSTNFPTTLNAFQPNYGGGTGDVFVTKLDSSGSLVYSTYLGGGNGELGFGIAVDGSGCAYVSGYTLSSNFPTANAFQPNNAGGAADAVVSKLSADGSALVYSTYLGGTDFDQAYGIAVDQSGNAYVAGTTASINFPLSQPFQPLIHGNRDAFITKFNASGSALIYSTYLGGVLNEQAVAIAVDGNNDVYVTGRTTSPDFPTANAYQPVYGQMTDAFVTKLNAAGSALIYSTFLGGLGTDYGYGMALDAAGNAYLTGQTGSSNFPTANPIQPSLKGATDAYLTKLNAAGGLIYSTFLGGSGDEGGLGVASDGAGGVYLTGFTRSNDFPTLNAVQSQYGGGPSDAFITKIVERPVPIGVVSRKTHGSVGTFDVDLPLTGVPGIECRTGGASGDHQVVVTFAVPVTFTSAAVTSGSGTVASSSASGDDVTINLTDVANTQIIAITLFGVNDGTNTGDVPIQMSVLVGDTTANGSVNSSDISQTKAQSGTAATSSNFREDVTVSGLINSSDISLVKSKSGSALP